MRRFRCAGSGDRSSRRTLASGRCCEAGTAREGVLSRGGQQGILAHASFAPTNRGSGRVRDGSPRGSSQRSLISPLRTTVLFTSPAARVIWSGFGADPAGRHIQEDLHPCGRTGESPGINICGTHRHVGGRRVMSISMTRSNRSGHASETGTPNAAAMSGRWRCSHATITVLRAYPR
jgi:hypothetical protein